MQLLDHLSSLVVDVELARLTELVGNVRIDGSIGQQVRRLVKVVNYDATALNTECLRLRRIRVLMNVEHVLLNESIHLLDVCILLVEEFGTINCAIA